MVCGASRNCYSFSFKSQNTYHALENHFENIFLLLLTLEFLYNKILLLTNYLCEQLMLMLNHVLPAWCMPYHLNTTFTLSYTKCKIP